MFHITCDDDFFFSDEGLFTNTFYCATEHGAFPDVEWFDFSKHVLTWWTNEVVKASWCEAGNFRLLFEDGPFWIDVKKQGENVLLQFCSSNSAEDTLPDYQMRFCELVRSIRGAVRMLSYALFCHNRMTESQEVNLLCERLTNTLEKCRK